MRTPLGPERSRPDTLVIVGAWCAVVAGLLGAAGLLVLAGGDAPRGSKGLALVYAVATLALTLVLLRSPTATVRAQLAIGLASSTGVMALVGALSFAPLFLPALALWLATMWRSVRAGRPEREEALVVVIWAGGLTLMVAGIFGTMLPG